MEGKAFSRLFLLLLRKNQFREALRRNTAKRKEGSSKKRTMNQVLLTTQSSLQPPNWFETTIALACDSVSQPFELGTVE